MVSFVNQLLNLGVKVVGVKESCMEVYLIRINLVVCGNDEPGDDTRGGVPGGVPGGVFGDEP